MNERYRGGKDIILDLPEEYDINHIDWLSIYCYKFRVDFGHIPISNISQRIPPYVPSQNQVFIHFIGIIVRRHRFFISRIYKFQFTEKIDGWPIISLLGTESRRNFSFQLGPPGGKKGYEVGIR